MGAEAIVALISQVIMNLPAAISTGKEVLDLINSSYRKLEDAIGNRTDVTPDEIDELIQRLVINDLKIQSL